MPRYCDISKHLAANRMVTSPVRQELALEEIRLYKKRQSCHKELNLNNRQPRRKIYRSINVQRN